MGAKRVRSECVALRTARLRSVEVGDSVVDVRIVAWLLRPDACTSDSSEQDGQVRAQTL